MRAQNKRVTVNKSQFEELDDFSIFLHMHIFKRDPKIQLIQFSLHKWRNSFIHAIVDPRKLGNNVTYMEKLQIILLLMFFMLYKLKIKPQTLSKKSQGIPKKDTKCNKNKSFRIWAKRFNVPEKGHCWAVGFNFPGLQMMTNALLYIVQGNSLTVS